MECTDLDQVVIEVPTRALTTIPGEASFRFIGEPGANVYMLPQAVLGKHVHGDAVTEEELPVPDHTVGMREVLRLFDTEGPTLAEAGIVAVGTTGESATLSVEEHLSVIEETVKHVNKRVPVIAGTGATHPTAA